MLWENLMCSESVIFAEQECIRKNIETMLQVMNAQLGHKIFNSAEKKLKELIKAIRSDYSTIEE